MDATSHSDLSFRLTSFFLKCIGVWAAEDIKEKRRMHIVIAYSIFVTSLGVVIQSRDMYFTWLYKGDTLYSFTNLVTIVMALVKMYIILMHKAEFLGLLEYTQDKFWNVKHDFQELKILDHCRKICAFFVCVVSCFAICCMISYVTIPIISNITNNQSERSLPFNLWLNIPLISVTPYYETLFLMQSTCLYYVGTCYFCFDNAFCIMSIHVAGQFRILQYRFTKLGDVHYERYEICTDIALTEHADLSYRKLRFYIREHQALINYCEKLENVYTMITLGQVIIFSLLICLFSYQVLVAECSFVRRLVFVCFIIGSMALLFMFTYSCDVVTQQSEKVAIAAYSSFWTLIPMSKYGTMFRKDLLFILARCRRVCCLTACGFFPVSLETYTTILSTATSYFTLMRNSL